MERAVLITVRSLLKDRDLILNYDEIYNINLSGFIYIYHGRE